MTPILAWLGRFAAIVIGYVAAVLVASLSFGVLLTGFRHGAGLLDNVQLFAAAFFAPFIGYFAFFPALLAIAAAEYLGCRGWLYYALAGAAVSVAAMALFLGTPDWRGGVSEEVDPALALVASGVVAGLTYWAITGRRAGFRRDP